MCKLRNFNQLQKGLRACLWVQNPQFGEHLELWQRPQRLHRPGLPQDPKQTQPSKLWLLLCSLGEGLLWQSRQACRRMRMRRTLQTLLNSWDPTFNLILPVILIYSWLQPQCQRLSQSLLPRLACSASDKHVSASQQLLRVVT